MSRFTLAFWLSVVSLSPSVVFSPVVLAQKTTLRLATFETNPYVSNSSEDKGIIYEILDAALSDAGYGLSAEFLPPLRALQLAESGELDLMLPSNLAPQKPDLFLYSEAIFTTHNVLLEMRVKAKGSRLDTAPVNTDEDHFISSEKMVRLLDRMNENHFIEAEVDPLVAAHAVIDQRPNLRGKIKFRNLKETTEFRLAVSLKRKDAAKIIADFNSALQNLKNNGSYRAIVKSYGYEANGDYSQTINIAALAGQDTLHIREIANDHFQSKSGMKIRWFIMPENRLRQRLLTSELLGDQAFDLVSLDQNDIKVAISENTIKALPPPQKLFKPEDLYPQVRSVLSKSDELYGYPFRTETSVTFYRKDLFAAQRLKMPNQPTYAQLEKFAKQLHNPGQGLYGLCLRGKPGSGENMPLLLSMAASEFPDALETFYQNRFTHRGWMKTINYYTKLLRTYGPQQPHRLGYKENLRLFLDGQCAIWVDGSSAAGMLLDPHHSKVSDKVGVVKPPFITHKEGAAWTNTWSFAIPISTTKPNGGVGFLQWLASEDYQRELVAQFGWIHASTRFRQSIYRDPRFLTSSPFASLIAQSFDEYRPPRLSGKEAKRSPIDIPKLWPIIGDTAGKHIALVVEGKATVKEALHRAQNESKDLVEKAKNAGR